jgi:hypothetical protein
LGSTNGFFFFVIVRVVGVGGRGQLRGRRRRLDQLLMLLLLLLLLVDAVDPAEGDWMVVVLHGLPAAGDGVVIVPLVRLNQATLAVYFYKTKCRNRFIVRLRINVACIKRFAKVNINGKYLSLFINSNPKIQENYRNDFSIQNPKSFLVLLLFHYPVIYGFFSVYI